jgi:hypothetical protein
VVEKEELQVWLPSLYPFWNRSTKSEVASRSEIMSRGNVTMPNQQW